MHTLFSNTQFWKPVSGSFPDDQIYRVDSLDDSTRLLHTLVRPTDTVLYENDLPDHYQEA